jgi:hypothetical protein
MDACMKELIERSKPEFDKLHLLDIVCSYKKENPQLADRNHGSSTSGLEFPYHK